MKILVTNTVALNTGDAAILLGLIETLRNTFGKETEFIIYDNQPDIAKKYYPQLDFRKSIYLNLAQPPRIKYLGNFLKVLNLNRVYFAAWCWKHSLQFVSRLLLSQQELPDLVNYSSADLIVSTGGTYLVENYPLESRIFDFHFSLLLRRPLILFTQSLGPFSTPKYRKHLKQVFEQALLILLRDKKSEKNVLDLNVEEANIHVTADAAFALANPSVIKAVQATKVLSSPPKIAISVRDWQFFKTVDPSVGRERYLQAIRAVSNHLVKEYGADITFISTCQGIPEYWTDDSKVASEIVENLPDSLASSIVLDKSFHSPLELAEILSSYDFVISTRLHMAILSLGAGTPVLPIAYEFKTQELFKHLDQGQWTLDIEDIDSELLINTVDKFIASIAEIRKTLFSAVTEERLRALEAGDLVKNVFERWSDL